MVSSTMKTILRLLTLTALMAGPLAAQSNPPASAAPPSASDLNTLLRDALFEEEANRDLTKAAAGYEALLAKWNEQRQVAAAALFRLAEVRRKQDRKDDAIKLYQRLVTEFPDIDPQARLARENLTALGVKEPAAGTAPLPSDPEEEKELRRLMMLVENSPDKVLEPVPWPESGVKDGKIGALSNAAMRGWTKVAAFLVEHGADPNITRNMGGPPLYAAAANGHKAICELLLAKGARINTASAALGNAIADNYTAVAELLIARGADINADTTVNLDETNKKVWLELTPLAIAISRDNKFWIDRLLALKADVNAAPNGQHMTALHVAAWKGNRVVLQKLLDLGANPDAPDDLLESRAELRSPSTDAAGWRALHYAATDTGMVEALLKAGANPSLADSNGLTPLHIACLREKLDCVKLLLAAKSDVNARGTVRRTPNNIPDFTDNTPLHIAATTANTAIIEALLAAGANPNPPVAEGQKTKTPLALAMNAVVLDNTKGSSAIAALLKAKADPNGTPNYSPVRLATGIQDKVLRETVLTMLLDAGADIELAIREAPADVRVPLLRNHRYPQLADLPQVTLTYPVFAFESILEKNEPGERPQPQTLASLMLTWHENGGWFRNNPRLENANWIVPDWSLLRLWRRGADGKFAVTEIAVQPGAEFPALQWGDVLEVVSKDWDTPPPAEAQHRRLTIRAPATHENGLTMAAHAAFSSVCTARITFKCDGFTKDLTLRGILRTYDPLSGEAPLLPVSQLVRLLAGPRPGTVHIQHGNATVVFHNRDKNISYMDDGGVITFTPDKPDASNLRVSLRVTGQPGVWQTYGPSQSVSLLQFLSEFYRALSPQLLVPGTGPDADATTMAEQIKALNADGIVANLIASAENPSGWPYLPWPDWRGVKVRRVKADEPKVTETAEGKTVHHSLGTPTWGEPESFDLLAAMKSLTQDSTPDDARKFDTILNPGDEVELPLLKDHPAGPWPGLDEAACRLFIKALTAKVTVTDPDGRFHQATLQWLPPRWVPTAAGVLPIPDGAATGGRVHWIRALQFVKSAAPGMEPNSVQRGEEFVVDPKQTDPADVFLRPGDRIMLRPAARPSLNQIPTPAPQGHATEGSHSPNPPPATNSPPQSRKRVVLPPSSPQ